MDWIGFRGIAGLDWIMINNRISSVDASDWFGLDSEVLIDWIGL